MRKRGLSGPRSRLMVGALTCVAALFLTQCKDAVAPEKVVTEDIVVPITVATVAAVEGVTFSFPAAAGAVLAPALANQPFSVAFTNTASATPTASFAVPGATGTDGQPGRIVATTTFGSCIFTVTSTNLPNIPLTITVNPCSINASTGGVPATGASTTVGAAVVFGTATSGTAVVVVNVSPTGVVTINGANAGTVTVVSVTGG